MISADFSIRLKLDLQQKCFAVFDADRITSVELRKLAARAQQSGDMLPGGFDPQRRLIGSWQSRNLDLQLFGTTAIPLALGLALAIRSLKPRFQFAFDD